MPTNTFPKNKPIQIDPLKMTSASSCLSFFVGNLFNGIYISEYT